MRKIWMLLPTFLYVKLVRKYCEKVSIGSVEGVYDGHTMIVLTENGR